MLFYAHRGDSRHHIENTALAFQSSVRHGFHAVELDLITLRDGEVVVFHDNNLSRLFSNPSIASELSLSEFHDIFPDLLTLDIFMSEFLHSGIHVNFEIKDSVDTFERAMSRIIQFPDYVISSFSLETVERVIDLSLPGAYLFRRLSDILKYKQNIRTRRVHMNYRCITDELTTPDFLNDFDVYCYTVNDLQTLNALAEFPFVKGVFTDDRDLPAKFASRLDFE